MNKVILCGRLTADPELRQTQSGVASCRFNIAIDRKYADKGTGEKQADFITCVAWRTTAEFIAKWFTKGKLIIVEGALRSGSYQDRNHPHVTHYTTEVYVDNVEFAGDKGGSNAGSQQQAPAYSAPAPQPQNKPQTQQAETMSYSNLSDFEEILSDGDVPF